MKCSRTLWSLTVFMVGFPILYPLLASFAFQFGSKGVVAVGLSPLFYIACVLWVFTGLGLQSLRHWSWYTFGVAQTLTVYINALNLVNLSESQFKAYAFALTLLSQALLHSLVAQEVRVPYLFPRIKWWESGIAGMHHVGADIVTSKSSTGSVSGQLLDVSVKGCFIKSPFDFDSGEVIRVKLQAYGQEVELPGQIVWNAKSAVTHPKGVGVQFLQLDRNLKRKLRVITKHFNEKKDLNHGITFSA